MRTTKPDSKTGLQVKASGKTKEEDAVLQETLEADAERTAIEAEEKFHELRDVVQVNL